MKTDSPTDPHAPRIPSWPALVVVCKDCQKRGSGPKRLKTKEAVQAARTALKTERPRPRVVTTSCLGLCPKRAIAIARVGGPGEPRIGAAGKAAAVTETVVRLTGTAPPA